MTILTIQKSDQSVLLVLCVRISTGDAQYRRIYIPFVPSPFSPLDHFVCLRPDQHMIGGLVVPPVFEERVGPLV